MDGSTGRASQKYASPPDPERYYPMVWEVARQIPGGRVCTYGQIAAWIPPPPGMDPTEYAAYRARWVGIAMARSPADVPWQRVLGAQGKISVSSGPLQARQRALLEAEGIRFDARGRVDLAEYGWPGPPPDWLAARGYLPPDPSGGQPRLDI